MELVLHVMSWIILSSSVKVLLCLVKQLRIVSYYLIIVCRTSKLNFLARTSSSRPCPPICRCISLPLDAFNKLSCFRIYPSKWIHLLLVLTWLTSLMIGQICLQRLIVPCFGSLRLYLLVNSRVLVHIWPHNDSLLILLPYIGGVLVPSISYDLGIDNCSLLNLIHMVSLITSVVLSSISYLLLVVLLNLVFRYLLMLVDRANMVVVRRLNGLVLVSGVCRLRLVV